MLQLLQTLNIKESVLKNHLEIWNKIDLLSKCFFLYIYFLSFIERFSLLESGELEEKFKGQSNNIVPISALKGTGISNLLCRLEEQIYPDKYEMTKQNIEEKTKDLEEAYQNPELFEELQQLCQKHQIPLDPNNVKSVFPQLALALIAKPRRRT